MPEALRWNHQRISPNCTFGVSPAACISRAISANACCMYACGPALKAI